MAIAYCILCHAHPGYVADLFRYLYRPEDQFLIHADAKGPVSLHTLISDLAARFSNVYSVPSSLCSWGGYSLVETTLRIIAFVSLGLPDCDHLVMLSEHHIPLAPPAEIARRLVSGKSYIDAVPIETYGPEGQDDVRHRFAMHYRELPGVGGFGTVMRDIPKDWAAGIYQGSQWTVLSREACRQLTAQASHRVLKERFGDSLLADETALQTALYATPMGANLTLDRKNQTFCASPDRGGTTDMEFTDASLRAARAQGYLFIRKRPAALPAELAASLESTAGLRPSSVTVPEPATPSSGVGAGTRLAAELSGHLGACRSGWIEVIEPLHPGRSPRCLLRVHGSANPFGITVTVLSEDLKEFKVTAVWDRPFDGNYAPCRIGKYLATVLKVRVPGLFLAREVHVLDDAHFGFVTLRSADAIGPLAETVDKALRLVGAIGEFAA